MVHPQKLFEEVNTALSENRMMLTIICVGGFVLEHHGLRATRDNDAFYRRIKIYCPHRICIGDEAR